MRRKATILSLLPLLLLSVGAAPAQPQGVLGYYRMPAVHGKTVAFVAEDDVWTVPLSGGLAHRLTRTDGRELYPRFSPDGNWIAFTGSYEGGEDVYVMPASGGEARRLTWDPEEDLVLGWTPGGKVLYRTSHGTGDGSFRTWAVSPDGGLPEPLPMAQSSRAAVSPDGHQVAFDRFDIDWMHHRRYQGAMAPDLYVGDLPIEQFDRLTTWSGTDTWPMWHGDRLFFQSDRTGILNLWSVKPDGTDLQENTRFDDEVRTPSIGGDTIVFQMGADLWAYDIPSGKSHEIDIRLETDRTWNHERHVSPLDHFDTWSPSPDGKRVYVEARGEIASFPVVDDARTIEITHDTPARERTASPSPDGKHVATWSDQGGEEHLVFLDANGLQPPQSPPDTAGGWHFQVAWSPKSDAVAWGDQTDTLWIYDLASHRKVRVDHDPQLEIKDYVFSPDGRWLAYVRTAGNANRVVWLYDRVSGMGSAATDPDYNSYSPAWDPDGKYLYFASQRDFDARITGDDSSPQLAKGPMGDMPELDAYWDHMSRPYVIGLKAGLPSPLLPADPLRPPPAAPPAPTTKKKGRKGKEAAKPQVKVDIDVQGLPDRTWPLPVGAANIWRVAAVKGRVLWLQREGLRLSDIWGPDYPPGEVHAFDFDGRRESTVAKGVDDFRVSADGKTLFLQHRLSFRHVDALARSAEDAKAVTIGGWKTTVLPSKEWAVIYDEAWRLYRDFFWSKDMVGVDWNAVKAKYSAYLPRIGSRSDLSDLIGESIAELANNHAYVWGGDVPHVPRTGVGQLGCDFEADPTSGYVRIRHIVPGQSWEADLRSPLQASGVDVKEGDWLFAIDGVRTAADRDPQSLLVGKANKDVVLTVGSTPDPAKAHEVVVHTLRSERNLRYQEWAEHNRETVLDATKGTVGYVHLRDMGSTGLQDFAKGWFAQTDMRGFIVDVRDNGGGYVANLVIERLHRALVALVEARNQAPIHEPWRSFQGPIVVLCDQRTASDGEAFTQAMQDLHLATVVGTRTWGGLVGYRYGKDLLDGGLSEPEFASYGLDRRWLVEGPGIKPDIVVDDDPTSRAQGKDLQLQKAIQVIQAELAKTPALPAPPPIPDKSLEAWRKRNPLQKVP